MTLQADSRLAGWPLKLLQWQFVLIYMSAVLSKMIFNGGLEWLNGFTLQHHLIQQGLRNGLPLSMWIVQHHDLVWLMSITVVLFQATFALAVLVPKLLWIYVPLGLAFHIGSIPLLWVFFPVVAAVAGAIALILPALDVLDRGKNFTLGYVCLAERPPSAPGGSSQ